jgi:hypothetical protein
MTAYKPNLPGGTPPGLAGEFRRISETARQVGDEVAALRGDVTTLQGETAALDAEKVDRAGDALAGTLFFPQGTALLPALSFVGDPNTGIFSPFPDVIGIATNGAQRVTIGNTSISSGVPYRGSNGTAAAPSVTFSGDTNTGMYRVAADDLGFSTGGAARFTVSSAFLATAVPVATIFGTAAAPGYAFNGDADTGFFRLGPDALGLTTGGTERGRFENTAATFAVPIVLPGDPTTALQAATKQYVDAGLATKPALPTASSGPGQWVHIVTGTGSAAVLPAGGTWAWAYTAWNMSTVPAGVLANTGAGISAGGATIGTAIAHIQWRGFAWRIA